MANQPPFDQRFDPAFQRGFENATAEAPAAAMPVQPAARPSTAPVATARQHPEFDDAINDATEDATDDEYNDEPRRGPNPFLVVLAVVSVVLIAGGLFAAQTIRAAYGQENTLTSIDYITFQLLIYAVPFAVGLGIATGIGVLFLYAVGWNRGAVTRARSNSRKNEA